MLESTLQTLSGPSTVTVSWGLGMRFMVADLEPVPGQEVPAVVVVVAVAVRLTSNKVGHSLPGCFWQTTVTWVPLLTDPAGEMSRTGGAVG